MGRAGAEGAEPRGGAGDRAGGGGWPAADQLNKLRARLCPVPPLSAKIRHHGHDLRLLGHSRAPDYDRSQWLNEKFKLGLDFPNLPYLIDGAHKITQSNAILRYIARKHNLCGETEEEKIRVDILENEVMDTRIYFARICYSPDFEKLKPEYVKAIPDKMKLYSQFLGKRPWFAGEKLTYVDFLVYDILDLHRIFEPTSLDAFPNLKEFMARFEGLKNISAYMKSSRFVPGPLFLKIAMWGNK
ncbi:glutathione S-transferase Mu 1 isoform X1 [Canis lupus dingo]|uniref:glutathione S-transferase Mu 1 isoform X1 n=1 Tax=Canis lupus dingo TaxID=286419 RepID=UPI00123476E3|nr:glutathione S-transferase Mu 1 isoform X1 [Canis lupus dingo]